ncbi:NADH-quinone oxidoreductase subunit C [Opitutaceae bacterium TAV4]|nr:NADH-quinone oxidoreductase subunit C [Opitutaceae bacterium TAV4]RRJ98503.1 NADH-quinone oxidoreductase subunit C [Opitutaceae bacterium TAV3]
MSADILAALQARFPHAKPRPSADHPAINVPITEAVATLQALRDEFACDLLIDVTGIDNGTDASPRFTTVWHVFSTTKATYIRVAADCASDTEPVAPTVSQLWAAANWHERETYDLLGITFSEHPDLRRILMWEGYPGHPLRKDFPLAGVETTLPDLEIAAVTGTPVIPAPMAGGPFVASPGEINLTEAEPRAKDESWNEQQPKPSAL